MFNSLYENIGGKIKRLAVWTFIVEAIGSIITGIALAAEEDILYIFIAIGGPIIAWVSSWILYAFGEMVEKTCSNEANTKRIAQFLEKSSIQEKLNNVPSNQTNDAVEIIDTSNGFVIQNSTLIKYNGTETDIIIPECVEILNSQAFLNNNRISTVTIPQGVVSISEWSFYKCRRLEKIIIPISVTHIGANAFYGCDNLTIFAPAESCAATYAKDYNISFQPII